MSTETIAVFQLKKFLESHEIPSVKQQPKTFLEIARQPHYENVISNIYAFYFDPYEEHGLGHLFITSFIECIKAQLHQEQAFLDNFQEFIIETEYGTDEKGRIDLFLYNNEKAIIIENKIYHHLANNLNDYWNTAKPKERKDNMVGVLLTLGKHQGSILPNFVNVLHLDFLKAVMGNIGNHLMEASDKYVTFLKDLYQNIENMSTKLLSPDDFKFYLENQNKILDVVKFNEQAKDHIKTQIVDAWNKQEGLEVRKATQSTYQFYSYREIKKDGVDQIYFCTWFDKLFLGEREVWISIYITSEYFKKFFNHQALKGIIEKYEKHGIAINTEHKEKGDWDYIAGKSYFLKDDQLINLQTTVEGFIKGDEFIMLFDELDEKLKELSASEL
ncbi:hypothetical protein GCM10011506_19820 [Marivirga lumbricoides]|uniref:PD-(D/E)XK nuclease superfamily protein n=1 Tax=Marivirga lumbricoides TaxID=1046115 RepID=A0ABQ1M4V5_9BACT|nr:hypothetical protein GCM10011506_19820 [Marivirga lumbricoides]